MGAQGGHSLAHSTRLSAVATVAVGGLTGVRSVSPSPALLSLLLILAVLPETRQAVSHSGLCLE